MGVLRQRATITGKKGGGRLTATILTLENGVFKLVKSVNELDNDSQNHVQKNFWLETGGNGPFCNGHRFKFRYGSRRLPVSYEKKI